MKRRFLAFFFIAILILSLLFSFGCNNSGKQVKILDSNLKDYTIVYQQYAGESVMLANETPASYTDYDFNRIIAEELRQKIKEEFGVELQIQKDTASEEVEKEILIGKTNRVNIKGVATLSPYDYRIGVVKTKLFLIGGSFATTLEASNKFFEYIKDESNFNNNLLNIDADFNLTGSKDLDTIACIGDSITAGYTAVSTTYFSYPAVLQRLNWRTAYVYNFGNSGKDMRNDNTKPYKNTTEWTSCKAVAENVDYLLIMLGTNDSYHDTNWTSEDDLSFVNSFMGFLNELKTRNENIKYTIMNCPKYYGGNAFAKPFILDLQYECYETALNAGFNIKHFDMNTRSDKYIGVDYFGDLLHPNTEGYCLLGMLVNEEVLQDLWGL